MSKPVKIYALSTCIHCKNAKQYLDECGVQYECVFVDKLTGEEKAKTVDEVKKLNPNLSFPTMQIGDTVVVGFNKAQITEALNK